jgi:hypothetical protein
MLVRNIMTTTNSAGAKRRPMFLRYCKLRVFANVPTNVIYIPGSRYGWNVKKCDNYSRFPVVCMKLSTQGGHL